MTRGPSRVSTGGRVDRSRPVEFSLDGRSMRGFHGDTLASASLANGVTLIGRSFKYHRPRGFLSAGSEEPNGLFTLGEGGRREPNIGQLMCSAAPRRGLLLQDLHGAHPRCMDVLRTLHSPCRGPRPGFI
jgi:sarcosine oxidase subunit alpha